MSVSTSASSSATDTPKFTRYPPYRIVESPPYNGTRYEVEARDAIYYEGVTPRYRPMFHPGSKNLSLKEARKFANEQILNDIECQRQYELHAEARKNAIYIG